MNKIFLFFLVLSLCTFSCQSDSSETSKTINNEATAPSTTGIAQLTCEVLSEDEVSPKIALYALVRENKIKIGEIVSNACQIISKDGYANYNIPAEAISAAGGWWAGAGDYFYIIEAENEYVVMKGTLDEMMEEKMTYKRIAGLQK